MCCASTLRERNSKRQPIRCPPAHQHNAKSFKDEPWYKSPIGFGSSASVVHAVLKQLDAHGTGFVRYHEIVEALQSANFGASFVISPAL